MNNIFDEDISKLRICGNCKYFKQHGVMGFDGYSEVCTNNGKFNMKERNWEESACGDFKK